MKSIFSLTLLLVTFLGVTLSAAPTPPAPVNGVPLATDVRAVVVTQLTQQANFALMWRDWFAYGPGDVASMTGEAESLHTAAVLARTATIDVDFVILIEDLATATETWSAKHVRNPVEKLAYSGRAHGYRLAAYLVKVELAK